MATYSDPYTAVTSTECQNDMLVHGRDFFDSGASANLKVKMLRDELVAFNKILTESALSTLPEEQQTLIRTDFERAIIPDMDRAPYSHRSWQNLSLEDRAKHDVKQAEYERYHDIKKYDELFSVAENHVRLRFIYLFNGRRRRNSAIEIMDSAIGALSKIDERESSIEQVLDDIQEYEHCLDDYHRSDWEHSIDRPTWAEGERLYNNSSSRAADDEIHVRAPDSSVAAPDLYFGFPVLKSSEKRSGLQMSGCVMNFSRQSLTAKIANGLVPCTFDLDHHQGIPVCYPWAVAVENQPGRNKWDWLHAKISLLMMEQLSLGSFSDDDRNVKATGLPPVITFICEGKNIEVWLAWIEPASKKDKRTRKTKKTKFQRALVWSGDTTNLWDVVQFCSILDRSRAWAVRQLRPWISSRLDQWSACNFGCECPNDACELSEKVKTLETRIKSMEDKKILQCQQDVETLVRIQKRTSPDPLVNLSQEFFQSRLADVKEANDRAKWLEFAERGLLGLSWVERHFETLPKDCDPGNEELKKLKASSQVARKTIRALRKLAGNLSDAVYDPDMTSEEPCLSGLVFDLEAASCSSTSSGTSTPYVRTPPSPSEFIHVI